MLQRLLISFCLAIPFAFADTSERRAFVIPLQQQAPEILIPSLRPLLAQGDGITSFNNQLVVTTSPDRIDAIRLLVQQLDMPSHNLLITVRSNSNYQQNATERSYSGDIHTGNVRIIAGNAHQENGGLTIRSNGIVLSADDSTNVTGGQHEQQVRALEGAPAFIRTGEARFVPTRDMYGNTGASVVEANQGFYVTARLVGERVLIDISTADDHFGKSTNTHLTSISTEHLSTQLSGTLDSWIPLGGITLQDQQGGDSLVNKTTGASHSLGDISLRITRVD